MFLCPLSAMHMQRHHGRGNVNDEDSISVMQCSSHMQSETHAWYTNESWARRGRDGTTNPSQPARAQPQHQEPSQQAMQKVSQPERAAHGTRPQDTAARKPQKQEAARPADKRRSDKDDKVRICVCVCACACVCVYISVCTFVHLFPHMC